MSPTASIQGNLIGTDVTGAATLGTVPRHSHRHLPRRPEERWCAATSIAGGGLGGITIGNASDSPSETIVQGNFIGTDVTGTIDSRKRAVRDPHLDDGRHRWAGPAPAKATSSRSTGARASHSLRPTNLPDAARSGATPSTPTTSLGHRHQCLGIDLSRSPELRSHTQRPRRRRHGAEPRTRTSRSSPRPSLRSSRAADDDHRAAQQRGRHDLHARLLRRTRPASAGRRTSCEGETYLGSDDVTTDGSGNAAINVDPAGVTLEPARLVTATATDPDGNTSEFSQRIVLRSTPGSGIPTGAPVTLDGFHFLAGATVTVGRRRRDERQRRELQPDHRHDAVASAGQPQRRDGHEHRRQRRHAAQRLDRGLPRRAGRAHLLSVRHDPRA